MFKLSYNANGLRNLNIEDAIKSVALEHYDGIELSLHKNHIHPYNIKKGQLDKIKYIASEFNIKIACLATGCADLLSSIPYEPSLISKSEADRKQRIDLIKRSIELAAYLECPVINFASGLKIDSMHDNDAKKYLIEGIHLALDTAEEIILAIEPEPEMFIDTTEKAIEIIKEINSDKFKLNLDIGHVYCCEDNYKAKIEKALEYTVHCHIEDIVGRRHYHQIPGTGDIEFEDIFNLFIKHGYDKYISVELYHHADVWKQALRESFQYLTQIVHKDEDRLKGITKCGR